MVLVYLCGRNAGLVPLERRRWYANLVVIRGGFGVQIRGLCMEYGVILILGAARVKSSLCLAITDGDNELTPSSWGSFENLYEELVDI